MHKLASVGMTIAVAAAAAACGGSGADRAALPAGEAAKLLIDRNWIDVWPESETQRLHVYRFTPSMGGGVYQDRTLFAGDFELFVFEVSGDRIRFILPHTKQEVMSRFRIEKVDGPEPFDLKLTLDPSPRGPGVYYGRTAERPGDAALFLPAQPAPPAQP